MQISEPELIATAIRANTLEGVTLLLSYLVLNLQKQFNASKPDEEEVNLISIETNDTFVEPYSTITLKDIKVDFYGGIWKVVEDPLGGNVKGSKYPWNSESVLDCLCHSFSEIFYLEKKTVNNPEEIEVMSLSFTQNTNLNDAMFTLNATYEVPLSLSVEGDRIIHDVSPYLVGTF